MRFRTILTHTRGTQHLPFLLGNYKYAPLPSPNCIRLLQVVPSTDDTVIQCSLTPFELANAPPFQALSYTWGSPLMTLKPTSFPKSPEVHDPLQNLRALRSIKGEIPYVYGESESESPIRQHAIICDKRMIKVTTNLRDALRMLANPTGPLNIASLPSYYWIDALCVNQENVLERSDQVARMAEIFKRADNVIVWLGREDEYTGDALETIEKVSAIPEETWPSIPYTAFYQSSTDAEYPGLNLSFYNWLGFIALINRPWFKRAWVSLSLYALFALTIYRWCKRLRLRSQLLSSAGLGFSRGRSCQRHYLSSKPRNGITTCILKN